MKWQITYPGHKTGNAKEERKKQTQTPTHLAQNAQTPENAREKKGERLAFSIVPKQAGSFKDQELIGQKAECADRMSARPPCALKETTS